MPSISPFCSKGSWYKGNLHTHTTQSDGKLTPTESMQWHADHGYQFMGITDHNRLTNPLEFNSHPPLLAIPSIEVSARRGTVEYHVICIAVNRIPGQKDCDPQEAINNTLSMDGIPFIAHPYWHDLSLNDLLTLQGYIGIEIFNTGCWLEIQKGHSLVHWDGILRRGQRVYGFAVDDSHFAYPDHGIGWIMVRSAKLDKNSILTALKQGQFYSSSGPELYDVSLEGRKVTITCSPARSIYVVGDIYHCPAAAQAWDGKPITSATLELHPEQKYFRIEIVDMEYHSAWTNAYFLDNLSK